MRGSIFHFRYSLTTAKYEYFRAFCEMPVNSLLLIKQKLKIAYYEQWARLMKNQTSLTVDVCFMHSNIQWLIQFHILYYFIFNLKTFCEHFAGTRGISYCKILATNTSIYKLTMNIAIDPFVFGV